MTAALPPSRILPVQQVRFALHLLGQAGIPLEELLRGTGIDQADLDDAGFAFRESALWPLCTNLATRFGADWYLKIPLLWGAELQSSIGLAVRSARNLGEGIETIVELVGLRWPIFAISRHASNGCVLLEARQSASIPAEHWPMVAIFAALNFQSTAATFLGEEVALLHYRFDLPPPPYAAGVSALLVGSVAWKASTASVEVPEAVLNRVSPLADTAAHAAMIETLRRSFARIGREDTVGARVAALLETVTQGQKRADAVAATFGMTRRTLERRLSGEGVSFGTLADTALKQRLERLLIDGHRSPDVLAEILGYHDGSSLMRACRRWYGLSLSALRQKLVP